jgi:hypothetical protein
MGPEQDRMAEDEQVRAHLEKFDELDFDVFSHQKWNELGKSHADDILVHWPDGHTTKGIERHIQDLQSLFAWAPDMHIDKHPIRIGQGDWTAVTSVMEGTFSKPMSIGDGKTIPPTGKHFKLEMVTLGHWRGDVMDEEYLFWDNQELNRQLGLAA